MPFVAPLLLWPGFARAVRARDYGRAFTRGIAWAALLSLGVILFVRWFPALAAEGIVNGEAYRREMFSWIETGVGREADWRQFLPQHLLHLGAFAALTAASGGYLGLVLGAFLTSYMSYFVASFAAAAAQPVTGAIVAWVPWSVVRVLAFVALGTVLARPVLVGRLDRFGRREKLWLAAAGGGILLDWWLKATLAPAYGELLRRWLALGAS